MAFSVQGQRASYLSLVFSNAADSKVNSGLTYQTQFSDSISLLNTLQDILLQLNKQSYLTATYLAIEKIGDTVFAKLDLGNQYRWISLNQGNVSDDILSSAGFKETQFRNKRFNPEQYARSAERILQVLENIGYPFASIKLDSIQMDSNGLSAQWNLDKSAYIVFDSINIIGNARIKKWYLHKYLGIKEGEGYHEQLIKNSDSRLSQLPFLSNTRNTFVYFYGNKAMPILYLNNRKASSIDGVIGFAPNTQTNNGQLLVTGEANLKLQNLFETGKSLDINYRSFLGNSQDLKVKVLWPYIFKSNIAVDYELAILKQDTTYLDVRNELGLQYRFIGTDYIKFFYTRQSSSLITVDTNQIKASRVLPEANDLSVNQYGLAIKVTHYDYFLNPRKGYSIDFSGSIGEKKIIKNATINSLVFYDQHAAPYSLYDSMPLNIIQYKGNLNADCFIPIASHVTWRIQGMGGWIEAPTLFMNELFRIGGIRTLKGFDEQVIFANRYMIANTELRYLLQQNSNFVLFWNGAYYENTVRKPVLSDKPFGFGAGLNFDTKAGVFSLFYALGKSFNNPIELNKAKVHFGFVNYF